MHLCNVPAKQSTHCKPVSLSEDKFLKEVGPGLKGVTRHRVMKWNTSDSEHNAAYASTQVQTCLH